MQSRQYRSNPTSPSSTSLLSSISSASRVPLQNLISPLITSSSRSPKLLSRSYSPPPQNRTRSPSQHRSRSPLFNRSTTQILNGSRSPILYRPQSSPTAMHYRSQPPSTIYSNISTSLRRARSPELYRSRSPPPLYRSRSPPVLRPRSQPLLSTRRSSPISRSSIQPFQRFYSQSLNGTLEDSKLSVQQSSHDFHRSKSPLFPSTNSPLTLRDLNNYRECHPLIQRIGSSSCPQGSSLEHMASLHGRFSPSSSHNFREHHEESSYSNYQPQESSITKFDYGDFHKGRTNSQELQRYNIELLHKHRLRSPTAKRPGSPLLEVNPFSPDLLHEQRTYSELHNHNLPAALHQESTHIGLQRVQSPHPYPIKSSLSPIYFQDTTATGQRYNSPLIKRSSSPPVFHSQSPSPYSSSLLPTNRSVAASSIIQEVRSHEDSVSPPTLHRSLAPNIVNSTSSSPRCQSHEESKTHYRDTESPVDLVKTQVSDRINFEKVGYRDVEVNVDSSDKYTALHSAIPPLTIEEVTSGGSPEFSSVTTKPVCTPVPFIYPKQSLKPEGTGGGHLKSHHPITGFYSSMLSFRTLEVLCI